MNRLILCKDIVQAQNEAKALAAKVPHDRFHLQPYPTIYGPDLISFRTWRNLDGLRGSRFDEVILSESMAADIGRAQIAKMLGIKAAQILTDRETTPAGVS